MPSPHADELALVQGLLRRDPGAWERFLARYKRVIEAACKGALAACQRAPDPNRVAVASAEILKLLL